MIYSRYWKLDMTEQENSKHVKACQNLEKQRVAWEDNRNNVLPTTTTT